MDARRLKVVRDEWDEGEDGIVRRTIFEAVIVKDVASGCQRQGNPWPKGTFHAAVRDLVDAREGLVLAVKKVFGLT